MKTPRLRMFAGPNGSGKSTIKAVVSPSLLGYTTKYIIKNGKAKRIKNI